MNRDKIKNISSDAELLSLLEAEENTITVTTVKEQVNSDKSTSIVEETVEYTDQFLLDLLEENGYDLSYSNLKMLKEGLKAGTITLEESKKDEKEEVVEEQPEEVQEAPIEGEEVPSTANVVLTPDGSVSAENTAAQIMVSPDKVVEINITEAVNYSDDQLLDILKENEYNPTRENLDLLREGLYDGTYSIVEVIPLDEDVVGTLKSIGGVVATAVKDGATKVWKGMKWVASSGVWHPVAAAVAGAAIGAGAMAIAHKIKKNKKKKEEEDAAPKKKKALAESAKAKPEGEIPTEEEVVEEEQPVEEAPVEGEEGLPRVQISMPVDGSMVIDNQGKQVAADAEGNITVALAEAKALRTTELFLKSYLIEDCGLRKDEYELLREEVKTESIKEIAVQLLRVIEEKLSGIDTSVADRSRGDIKQLRELPTIQDSLSKLESMMEREDNVNPDYVSAVNTVIKSILYINQYSSTFKDAYRNKKTVMIMKYQALILAVISSISYIVAALIQSKNGTLSLKDSVEGLRDFAPLMSLDRFNKSVDSGEFKKLVSDTNTLREYFLEIPVEKMSSILEASDYLPMIVDGVKNIYNSISSDGKITGLLYKVVGVIVTLFSLRDVFYSLFRMRTKIGDMLNQLQVFAGSSNGTGNALGKLAQFASKFLTDAESGSDLAKKEMESEDRRVVSLVRQAQNASIIGDDEPAVKMPRPEAPAPATSDDLFGFDF